jgi:phosphate transport system substrate-binding protein
LSNFLTRFINKKKLITGVLVGLAAVMVAAPVTVKADTGAALRISGSTTCFPIVAYTLGIDGAGGSTSHNGTYHTNQSVSLIANVQQGGSGQGLADLKNGLVDIGMSSSINSAISASDLAVVDLNEFARDGVCIIINKSSQPNVSQLTFTQIAGIFAGSITNWNQVGGSDALINVYGRITTSGTRDTLLKVVGGAISSFTNDSNVSSGNRLDTSATVKSTIGGASNSICYETYGLVSKLTSSDNIAVLKIENDISSSVYVTPTAQTITSGAYPLARTLKLLTLKDHSSTYYSNASAYIQYLQGRLGQQDVVACGYVALNPAADINHDARVSLNDVTVLGQNWGKTGDKGWIAADVNADGRVSINDLTLVGQWWGVTYTRY